MIEIIVENGGAVIEGGASDGDALFNVLLGLEDVVCELIDLTEELLDLIESVRFSQCRGSSHRLGHEMRGNS